MMTYLDKGSHVWLLHRADGRLHQCHGSLQLLAVAAEERSRLFQLVVLLPADEPHQLLLPLLQARQQPLKMAVQPFPLLLSILLRTGVRGQESDQSSDLPSAHLYRLAQLLHLGDEILDVVVTGNQHGNPIA